MTKKLMMEQADKLPDDIFAFNFGGVFILGQFFYKRNIVLPEPHPKKAIWKPLIVGIAICAFFIALNVLV